MRDLLAPRGCGRGHGGRKGKVQRGLGVAVTAGAAAAGRALRSAPIFPPTRNGKPSAQTGLPAAAGEPCAQGQASTRYPCACVRASLPETGLLGWMETRCPRHPAWSPTRRRLRVHSGRTWLPHAPRQHDPNISPFSRPTRTPSNTRGSSFCPLGALRGAALRATPRKPCSSRAWALARPTLDSRTN